MKLLFGLLMLGGCGQTVTRTDASELAAVETNLQFFRHHATGICFAYAYVERGIGDAATGGPALAVVDCARVGFAERRVGLTPEQEQP